MAEQVKLMNMCMIMDKEGQVLVQNRKKNDWDGLTFPGGKVEPGESLTASVIREVWEETGLTIENPLLCGITHWYQNDKRQIVFLYKTETYSGQLQDSPEGHMEWMPIELLWNGNAAFGMEDMIKVFLLEDSGEVWYPNSPESWERIVL